MNKFASIIITHWGQNQQRSAIMRASMDSLFPSLDYPCEIIVIDNGESSEDSEYLLMLNKQKRINAYIRNAENMSFGFARNQGLAICNGDYIVIVDNDIIYQQGWLTDCIKVLEAYPDKKIYATPVHSWQHVSPRYWVGELDVDGEKYKLNYREGSNCFVIRRQDMITIGGFSAHRIAGTVWTTRACKYGFTCAITPKPMVKDIGVGRGYNIKESRPLRIVLSDGNLVYFNQDSFWRAFKRSLFFRFQKPFHD